MVPVSIVITTKSKADIIPACIDKARLITDDIIVINSDSAAEPGATETDGFKLFVTTWDGYGANKNKGIKAAKYNWILSIDADEVPDDELVKALHQLNFNNPSVVYDIKFRSYFGKKPVRFGSWGRDHHIRLFNRTLVQWSETMVHETLILPESIEIEKLEGHLHHYSVKDTKEYAAKCTYYAKLSAKKYFRSGKKANAVKLYLSPLFGFFKNYVIYLGFLDGREGWQIAKITARSTRLKYYYLSQIENQPEKTQPVKDGLLVEY